MFGKPKPKEPSLRDLMTHLAETIPVDVHKEIRRFVDASQKRGLLAVRDALRARADVHETYMRNLRIAAAEAEAEHAHKRSGRAS